MKRTLLMEAVMGETRLAVIEDGALCELYVDRPSAQNAVGNIYVGRVENVLPGMDAAFVDIGLDKNGFLSIADYRSDLTGDRALTDALKAARGKDALRPGQEVLVQVTKAATGQKGPRLSGAISLPGRNLVLLPGINYVGVSRRIDGDDARARLRETGRTLLGEYGHGLIMRTAAKDIDPDVLRAEYSAMAGLWREIETRAAHAKAPALLYSDADLVTKAVRDKLGADIDALWTDDAGQYAALTALASRLTPRWAERIRQHDGATPLFDLYRVDEQLDKALQKYVWLKSGGLLVIEQTEALTVVDVNTGKFTGKKALGETVFKNNCEAAREIMRQLRLRDLSGIIVVDFIDMDDAGHRQALLDVLREEVARDANRVNVVGMTALGLVEMTRKKARPSLERQLLHTCSDCGGNGVVPSHETTARRIERALWRRRRAGETSPILVEAAEPVCGWLRTLGTPEGGATYACPKGGLPAGEYRLSPADPAALPPGSKRLK